MPIRGTISYRAKLHLGTSLACMGSSISTPHQSPRYLSTYQKDLAAWFTSQPWTYFATFTTPYHLSIPSARRLMERTSDRWRSVTGQLTIAYCIEANVTRDGYHLHALVLVPEQYTSPHNFQRLIDGYRNSTGNPSSIIQLSRYDASKGGARYLTKAITERSDRWDLIH